MERILIAAVLLLASASGYSATKEMERQATQGFFLAFCDTLGAVTAQANEFRKEGIPEAQASSRIMYSLYGELLLLNKLAPDVVWTFTRLAYNPDMEFALMGKSKMEVFEDTKSKWCPAIMKQFASELN